MCFTKFGIYIFRKDQMESFLLAAKTKDPYDQLWRDYLPEGCKSVTNLVIAFAVIALVCQCLCIAVAVINLFCKGKKILLPLRVWFTIFHLAMYVCVFVMYLGNFFYVGDKCINKKIADLIDYKVDWSNVMMMIVSIVGIVGCILALLPLKKMIFALLYLIFIAAHLVCQWIAFLGGTCSTEPNMSRFWMASGWRWITYTLVGFIMTSAAFVFALLTNLDVNFKMAS
ncbi:uncharacterized protein MONOS_3314 [Monocercomonoides exilis]|uniref:uncharacterized protein n=1 Tax=Monocercomonoides exilis TaxID=2049356 RepID=UPI00355A1757|nr:hypothetical protein MONOS_3314 [Monocercomonoides exilis]|eukprot:MONOS_3314.1-p1 / transcript=MONOS_3314.1 / gene=MONOS_3314 / organism=Monocercomonoides_exilis_PA203 / gene_product=unspecified product / transcript_product=unspecified product / location=Mono_scaffold00077:33836-34578(-) / protein_length=227 / sequence_SO=supercontig / SO=protein_coding / is_pseudo=false